MAEEARPKGYTGIKMFCDHCGSAREVRPFCIGTFDGGNRSPLEILIEHLCPKCLEEMRRSLRREKPVPILNRS